MTGNERLKEIKALNQDGIRDLAENQSCKFNAASDHERRLFASGFRKGFKAARRGDFSLRLAVLRLERDRNGDSAWAEGYQNGVKYVPFIPQHVQRAREKGKKKS